MQGTRKRGDALLALGGGAGLGAAYLDSLPLAIAAGAVLVVGGALLVGGVRGYAASRGQVKAAAAQPKPEVIVKAVSIPVPEPRPRRGPKVS